MRKGERFRTLCYHWQEYGGQGRNSDAGGKTVELVEQYEDLIDAIAYKFAILPSLLKAATHFTILLIDHRRDARRLEQDAQKACWKRFRESTLLALREAHSFLKYPERLQLFWQNLTKKDEIYFASLALLLKKAAYLEIVPDLENPKQNERLRLFARLEQMI